MSRHLELRRGGGKSSTVEGGLLFQGAFEFEAAANEPSLLCVQQGSRVVKQTNTEGEAVQGQGTAQTSATGGSTDDVLTIVQNDVTTVRKFSVDPDSTEPNVFAASPITMSRQTRFDATPAVEDDAFGQEHAPHIASISEVINFRAPRGWSDADVDA